MSNSTVTQPRYYVAYGSNLNLPQMRRRCPTAKVVGSDVLTDRRLRFRGIPNSAVATIEPAKNHTVPVLIFEIQPQDEFSLDRYEGYPTLYRKEQIGVKVDGQPVNAFAYIMNEKNHPYNQPGSYYFSVILAGYLMNDFEVAQLQEAVEQNPR